MLLSQLCNIGSAHLPTTNMLTAIETWLHWQTLVGDADRAEQIRKMTQAFFAPRFMTGGDKYQPHAYDPIWMCLEASEGSPVWCPSMTKNMFYATPSAGFDRPGVLDGNMRVPAAESPDLTLGLLTRASHRQPAGIADNFYLLLGSPNYASTNTERKEKCRAALNEMGKFCKELEAPSEEEAK